MQPAGDLRQQRLGVGEGGVLGAGQAHLCARAAAVPPQRIPRGHRAAGVAVLAHQQEGAVEAAFRHRREESAVGVVLHVGDDAVEVHPGRDPLVVVHRLQCRETARRVAEHPDPPEVRHPAQRPGQHVRQQVEDGADVGGPDLDHLAQQRRHLHRVRVPGVGHGPGELGGQHAAFDAAAGEFHGCRVVGVVHRQHGIAAGGQVVAQGAVQRARVARARRVEHQGEGSRGGRRARVRVGAGGGPVHLGGRHPGVAGEFGEARCLPRQHLWRSGSRACGERRVAQACHQLAAGLRHPRVGAYGVDQPQRGRTHRVRAARRGQPQRAGLRGPRGRGRQGQGCGGCRQDGGAACLQGGSRGPCEGDDRFILAAVRRLPHPAGRSAARGETPLPHPAAGRGGTRRAPGGHHADRGLRQHRRHRAAGRRAGAGRGPRGDRLPARRDQGATSTGRPAGGGRAGDVGSGRGDRGGGRRRRGRQRAGRGAQLAGPARALGDGRGDPADRARHAGVGRRPRGVAVRARRRRHPGAGAGAAAAELPAAAPGVRGQGRGRGAAAPQPAGLDAGLPGDAHQPRPHRALPARRAPGAARGADGVQGRRRRLHPRPARRRRLPAQDRGRRRLTAPRALRSPTGLPGTGVSIVRRTGAARTAGRQEGGGKPR
ncbi:hypothetical protein SBRY_40526 [Actinacidiphila bryophytorum]|uniref:Uncharacterized protein n=1 Tax=Actinacidiphila bryophytorum TaxID=1436133 RepID=A0A9W4H350_9ACTN|nr:hypothetical protein SBRY_40526 [Actinacidiphila bryophytorum]